MVAASPVGTLTHIPAASSSSTLVDQLAPTHSRSDAVDLSSSLLSPASASHVTFSDVVHSKPPSPAPDPQLFEGRWEASRRSDLTSPVLRNGCSFPIMFGFDSGDKYFYAYSTLLAERFNASTLLDGEAEQTFWVDCDVGSSVPFPSHPGLSFTPKASKFNLFTFVSRPVT